MMMGYGKRYSRITLFLPTWKELHMATVMILINYGYKLVVGNVLEGCSSTVTGAENLKILSLISFLLGFSEPTGFSIHFIL